MILNSFFRLINSRLENTTSLRYEYCLAYPKDREMQDRIGRDVWLDVVWEALVYGTGNVFDDLCQNDSIVREVAFFAMSDKTGLPYDFFYYLWLGDEPKAFETLYSENSTGKTGETADDDDEEEVMS